MFGGERQVQLLPPSSFLALHAGIPQSFKNQSNEIIGNPLTSMYMYETV